MFDIDWRILLGGICFVAAIVIVFFEVRNNNG